MSDCKHNRLHRVDGPALPSKSGAVQYRCEDCKELLLVKISPVRIVVSEGPAAGSKEHGHGANS